MSNQKYFLLLLWIPFVPVIFYKDNVIRFIKEKSTTMNPWQKTDVWQSTTYLKVTKAKPTSNSMNKILLQRSFHTTPTLKPTIPDVWRSTPYIRVTKAKLTSNAMDTILPQRSPHKTSTSKQKVPDVWRSTPHMGVAETKSRSNAMKSNLPQRSPHTTPTSKQKVPVPSEKYHFSKGPTSSYYKVFCYTGFWNVYTNKL